MSLATWVVAASVAALSVLAALLLRTKLGQAAAGTALLIGIAAWAALFMLFSELHTAERAVGWLPFQVATLKWLVYGPLAALLIGGIGWWTRRTLHLVPTGVALGGYVLMLLFFFGCEHWPSV